MVVEAALMLGGLVATVAIGGPMAARMARPHLFKSAARRDATGRERATHQPAFTPMDLGPDPMKWPSARPWGEDRATPSQEWPSKSWDDEHYGAHWRDGSYSDPDDAGFHVMADRRSPRRPGRRSRVATKAVPAQAETPVAAPAPVESVAPNTTVAPASTTLPARQPPGQAEIEALISQLGLAGTVQVIMQRTGWDFRKAAHFLAKTRQR